MRYWVFVFVLALISFGFSGVLYIVRDFDYVVQGTETAQLEVGFNRMLGKVQPEDFELLFVGDVMLSRGVGAQMLRRQDFYYPFRRIALTLRGADFVFANLEGPISNRGINQGSEYSFRADPRVVDGLKFAGFDVLSLANNHALDWGREAMFDTIDILETNDVYTAGAGENLDLANQPAVLCVEDGTSKYIEISRYRDSEMSRYRDGEILGYRDGENFCSGISVAVFAYTNLYPLGLVAKEDYSGVSDFRLVRILKDIRAIRDEVDFVVVSYHWGEEYAEESNEEQSMLAHAIIDAGADFIIGHHPHVVQEIEKYKDGWIAYSLGNFVFDQDFSDETMRGAILRVLVRDGRVFSVEELGTRISSTYQVYLGE
ncbi:hypothetical protein CL629_01130 [bacterium]|nr:hypothetical protein [bacterium]|tara:strand:+ start:2407 stop:3522 length:1116 start_codon:yes stop_codon:yes gene_type:complete